MEPSQHQFHVGQEGHKNELLDGGHTKSYHHNESHKNVLVVSGIFMTSSEERK